MFRASDTYCKAQNYQQNGVKDAKQTTRKEGGIVEQKEK